MSEKNAGKAVKIAAPFIIILLGVVLMTAAIKSRSAPERQQRPERGALVETAAVRLYPELTVGIEATGVAASARSVAIVPQVSGKVGWVSSSFVSGGFFRSGELMFSIDKADYELQVEKAMAEVARQQQELATTEGKAEVARREWELINPGSDSNPHPLVLYEPQLKNAEASLASALASLKQARLNLQRTEVRAPFNGRVSTEHVEPGYYASPGREVAVFMGTDYAEITVPLEPAELAWLDIPDTGGKSGGSAATVTTDFGGRWSGRVARSTGEVDPKSRMINVIVQVSDPYGLDNPTVSGSELVSGLFTRVSIKGGTLKDVLVIPVGALREGSSVWVAGQDNTLTIRKVKTLRTVKEGVIVTEGLSEGQRVVLTRLSGVSDGMKLRPVEGGAK